MIDRLSMQSSFNWAALMNVPFHWPAKKRLRPHANSSRNPMTIGLQPNRAILFRFYFCVLHAILVLAIWKLPLTRSLINRLVDENQTSQKEISPFFHRMVGYHERSIPLVPNDAVIFFGNSITQSLCEIAVSSNAVNFGIGGDTTAGLLSRLPKYEDAIKRSRAVMIEIGINDLPIRDDDEILRNIEDICNLLAGKPIVISSIMPVDPEYPEAKQLSNERISRINSRLAELISNRPSVVFLDNSKYLDANHDGKLDPELHVDGVHLNAKGNMLWVGGLKSSLAKVSP